MSIKIVFDEELKKRGVFCSTVVEGENLTGDGLETALKFTYRELRRIVLRIQELESLADAAETGDLAERMILEKL